MEVGMLWFDDNPGRDLPAKVQRAADYYRQKYGRVPTVCQVNPAEGPLPDRVGGISLRRSSTVLQGHLWLGVEEIPC